MNSEQRDKIYDSSESETDYQNSGADSSVFKIEEEEPTLNPESHRRDKTKDIISMAETNNTSSVESQSKSFGVRERSEEDLFFSPESKRTSFLIRGISENTPNIQKGEKCAEDKIEKNQEHSEKILVELDQLREMQFGLFLLNVFSTSCFLIVMLFTGIYYKFMAIIFTLILMCIIINRVLALFRTYNIHPYFDLGIQMLIILFLLTFSLNLNKLENIDNSCFAAGSLY